MILYAVSTNNHSKAVTINKVLQAEKIDILRCVSHYVKEILENLSSIYTFHSLQHTIEVVEASMEIAKHCNLGSNELELLTQSEVRNGHWCFENLNFLRQHQYHTKYGKNVLSKHKQANLSKSVQKPESLKAL